MIAKLRAEGAVFVGKTNMDEFAMGSSTENSAFGPTHAIRMISSASPADLPAAQPRRSRPTNAWASLGTDTGGSIREPASFCGVVGIKPTYSRVSRYGVIAYASSLDQVGPFAKTVRDAAIMLRSLAGVDPRDSTCSARAVPDYERALTGEVKGLRIGVPKEYFVDRDGPAKSKSSVRAALAKLTKRWARGWSKSRCRIPRMRSRAYYLVATAEASANLARYDGIRYGLRVPPTTISSCTKPRARRVSAPR